MILIRRAIRKNIVDRRCVSTTLISHAPATNLDPTQSTSLSNKERQDAIKNQTKRLFESRPISQDKIIDHIKQNLHHMNSYNVATLMHGIGKYRVNIDAKHVRAISGSVTEKQWSQEQLGKLFYGMKNMKPAQAQTLVAAGLHILTSGNVLQNLGPRTIGSILVGLNNIPSSDPNVREILNMLGYQIDICDEPFLPEDIAVCMSGFRNKQPEHMEVGLVIASLSKKIIRQADIFSGEQFSICVNMMHEFSSDQPEVVGLVNAWVETLENGRVAFLSPAQIGHCVMGLRRMDNTHASVNSLLDQLAMRLLSCDVTHPVNVSVVSDCLFGLQHMKQDSHATRRMHQAITRILSIDGMLLHENDGDHFGRMLYGLKNVFPNCNETVQLVIALGRLVQGSPPLRLTSKTIGHALFGLQNLHHNHRCSLMLIRAVADQLSSYTGTMDQDGVAASIFGLRNMVADRAAVKHLLIVLTDIINRSPSQGSSASDKCVGQAYHGLQCLSNNHVEVDHLLGVLNSFFFPRLPTDTSPDAGQGTTLHILPRNMATALYGLQSTRSTPESLRTLSILGRGISTCSQQGTHYQIASSLFGMQHMDMRAAEVQEILNSIHKHWLQNISPSGHTMMSLDHLGMALYGVASLLCDYMPVASYGATGEPVPAVVLDITRSLLQHVPSDLTKQLPSKGLTNCCRSLLLLSHFTCSSSDEAPLANAIPQDVYTNLQALVRQVPAVVRNSSGYRVGSNLSRFEKLFANIISKALSEQEGTVEFVQKGVLLQAFEADVVVTLKPGAGRQIESFDKEYSRKVINIEIDGAHHIFPAKQRFCHMRDRYLVEAKDVEVRRINLESVGHLANDKVVVFSKQYADNLVASVRKSA